MFLRCSVSDTPKQWLKWLPLAELWYNTSYHSAIQCTPFKALYGVDPSRGAVPLLHEAVHHEVSETLLERQHFSELLKERLQQAQNRMKLYADKKRSERVFQVGEMVLLKLQPYSQSSLVNRPCPKLAMKFFGPYKIVEKIGPAAYKLDLPADCLIHPVFHVSQLKEFTPDHTPVFSSLPAIPTLDCAQLEPEKILDRRLTKKGNTAITQVLIKWHKLPEDMATWEDYYVLKTMFPSAAAWGHAASQEGVLS